MRLKTTARYGLPVLLAGLFVLCCASAIFFYRGQRILLNLIAHGQNVPTTNVYGRWWTLSPESGLTWLQALAVLQRVDYTQTAKDPQHAGEFQAAYPQLTLYLHPFNYPDGATPGQKITLHFDQQRLARVDGAVAPHGQPWRLEPEILTQWSTDAIASRKQIFLIDIPSYVPAAIVAIEDKRFYKHGAFDGLGVLRAFIVNIRHGHVSQGASTLSQQLARSIFLTSRRTVSRKLMEAVLAVYLELRFSKRELLEMYINQVYWGQEGSVNLLGVDAASHAYFGKPPRDLTLAEAALLAGLLQSPNHYSPRNALAISRERRNLVLKLMHEQHLISTAQYQEARHQPVHIVSTLNKGNEAAYFLASLQDSLEDHYAGVVLPTAGWTIYTTLDPVLEHEAVLALQRTPHAQGLSIHPESALVGIDPKSGAVRAWVGGTDYSRAPFDRASRAHRQPGSAFKPFVMLTALDRHVATTATWLPDDPLTIQTGQGPWSPQNYDHHYRHRATLWESLVQSLNVPTVNLALKTGLSAIADNARRAGIVSPLSVYPSMALGASDVTPVELTNAYATLAAGGIYRAAYVVDWIVDTKGQPIETHTQTPAQALNPQSVALVTHMLQDVLLTGTGAAARALGLTFSAAGKTGTSENYQDAWFVGYTPDIACGVWVGYDQPKSLGHAAAGIALPIWVSFMEKAIRLTGETPFQDPPGLITKTIDPDTGFLARSGCPTRKSVLFLPGTDPTQECVVHAGGIVGFFHRLLSPKKVALPTVHH